MGLRPWLTSPDPPLRGLGTRLLADVVEGWGKEALGRKQRQKGGLEEEEEEQGGGGGGGGASEQDKSEKAGLLAEFLGARLADW